MRVEIDYMFGEKPWLGGFRHRLTKKEFLHAACQTVKLSTKTRTECQMVSRPVQVENITT